jgi:hypothetical protein
MAGSRHGERVQLYLDHSLRWEREYANLLARLEVIAADLPGREWTDLTVAERANIEPIAAQARGKVRRIFQARQIVRRLHTRPDAEIVSALHGAGLGDRARAFQDADLLDLTDA